MRILPLFIILLFLSNCSSKPKTVLICGDHVCINNKEADQYFEENLSIEVKIIDKKIENEIDLIELNLNNKQNGKKSISMVKKNKTNKKLKVLSSEEINEIKKDIKNKKNQKKLVKKVNIDNNDNKLSNEVDVNNIKKDFYNNVKKRKKDVVDVCTIVEKCSISEISKYLLKQGQKKDFPDITIRE